MGDTNWTWAFSFLFCGGMGHKGRGNGPGRAGKWIWSRFMMWTSQIINKISFYYEQNLNTKPKKTHLNKKEEHLFPCYSFDYNYLYFIMIFLSCPCFLPRILYSQFSSVFLFGYLSKSHGWHISLCQTVSFILMFPLNNSVTCMLPFVSFKCLLLNMHIHHRALS